MAKVVENCQINMEWLKSNCHLHPQIRGEAAAKRKNYRRKPENAAQRPYAPVRAFASVPCYWTDDNCSFSACFCFLPDRAWEEKWWCFGWLIRWLHMCLLPYSAAVTFFDHQARKLSPEWSECRIAALRAGVRFLWYFGLTTPGSTGGEKKL